MIKKEFYLREDVVKISQELIGKYLFTRFNGITTGGIITETEAYAGITDKASHAYSNRRTQRTEVMYASGGVAYVYLCYGMYPLFNIVTHKKNIPHAVLIRGIHPTEGIGEMLTRIKKKIPPKEFCQGPGRLTKALGITCNHTGIDLTGKQIWLEDRGINIYAENLTVTKRVGIDYAGKDADLPYRFILKDIRKVI